MQSPVKKEFITQVFGANPANYAQFGLKGHNGVDFRAFLPNGDRCYVGGKSEVFTPHSGKVLENALDSNGYGNYIKIENDKEGSVLAHFSSRSAVPVGATVTQGQLVGFQGTTGNSTGIHLHWGYYKKPRDRQNGYNGFINQAGLYNPYGEPTMGTIQVDSAVYEMLVTKATKYDEILAAGYITKAQHDAILAQVEVDKKNLEQKNVDLQVALTACENKPTVPTDPDMTKWELNGLVVTNGNNSYNYKLRE